MKRLKKNTMKVLLITSKWSVPGEDIDGGSMTTRDVLDTIAADSIVDLLLPEGYKGFNIIGAKNIFYYPIDDDIIKNYNGSNKFICRIKISRLVGTIVSKIHNNYDKIVILHTFHAFEICSWNNAALNKKIVLFPMLLTPSYINSGEIVPQYYIRNEKKTLKVVGKIITPSLYEQNQLEC